MEFYMPLALIGLVALAWLLLLCLHESWHRQIVQQSEYRILQIRLGAMVDMLAIHAYYKTAPADLWDRPDYRTAVEAAGEYAGLARPILSVETEAS